MKKTLILFGALSAMLITGCDIIQEKTVQFKEQEIDFYATADFLENMQQYYLTPESTKEHCYKGAKKFYFHPAYENIVYTDFKSYFSLLALSIPEKFTYEISELSFVLKNDKGNPIFVAAADVRDKTFTFSGEYNISTATEEEMKIKRGSLFADLKIETKHIIEPTVNAITCSYRDFSKDFQVVYQNHNLYAPIQLFDAAFGIKTSTYHIFDSKQLVQYSSVYSFTAKLGADDNFVANNLTNFMKEKGDVPKDLLLIEKSYVYYIMENFYGLQNHKHIKSMTTFFNNLGFDKSLLVNDQNERVYNNFDLYAALDDDHTGLSSIAPWWGDSQELQHRSQRSQDRNMITESLKAQRNAKFGEESTTVGFGKNVHYSTSGETAYFYFDSFTFDPNPYDETKRDSLWETDSYIYFIHQFEEIKKHGGVRNVIIDDSCNGGGTIGIAIKLSALISKDNQGHAYMNDMKTGGLSDLHCQVDSNQDGKYDKDDVYGDDFNIAILTAPGSFSCGNLFPVMAKYTKDALVIGKTSGGGECSVSSTQLPSGRGLSYSSMSRLVTLDENNKMTGVELGAKPDIDLSYYQFVEIDQIEALIKAHNA